MQSLAATLGSFAVETAQGAATLRRLSLGGWVGRAAEVFTDAKPYPTYTRWLERTTIPTVGVVEFNEMYWAKPAELTVEQVERALAAPICERGRRETEDQLAALRSP